MNKKTHDPLGRGWNPPPLRHSGRTDQDGLETMTFTGENFLDIHTFTSGNAYRLSADTLLIDAGDRVLMLRLHDCVVRYPNGLLGRHRPPTVVSPNTWTL